MEEVAGRKLRYSYDQWLFEAGHPQIKFDFTYRQGRTNLRFEQIQSHYTFRCPIEVQVVYSDETTELKTFKLRNLVDEYQLKSDKKVVDIRLDPNVKLLFEEIK
jgi:aminopeptidase N